MKFQPDNEKTTIAIYAFLVVAAAIAFYMLLQQWDAIIDVAAAFAGYIRPAIYGFIIAFLLNPAVRFFEDRVLPGKIKRIVRRGLSILITYIIALVLIGLFVSIVIPQLIGSLIGIGAQIPSYIKALQTFYFSTMESMSGQFFDDPIATTILATISGYALTAFDAPLAQLGEWLTHDLLDIVVLMVNRLISGVFGGILGFIFSIYFLIERERLMAQAKKLCVALFKPKTFKLIYEIVLDTNRVFGGFILGKIIESVIMGILCFIGMTILRLPLALLVSAIVGVFNVIPYFGSIVGAIPGIILLFITDPEKGPVQALIFFIFILVLQQFDGNVMGPKILGDSTGLNALWVIFAVMLFAGLFSVVGMLIGVPLFAVIYHMTRRLVNYILRRKGESEDTADYASDKNPLLK